MNPGSLLTEKKHRLPITTLENLPGTRNLSRSGKILDLHRSRLGLKGNKIMIHLDVDAGIVDTAKLEGHGDNRNRTILLKIPKAQHRYALIFASAKKLKKSLYMFVSRQLPKKKEALIRRRELVTGKRVRRTWSQR